ncbi:hypothetical protein [Rubrivivax gelatinosus]|uniref:Oxidoreductase molybdopterin-binding domain-containing protein n=2 Tax=Rubrivivax gelatinosus TaxID=28068 RepID=A0A4V2SGR0_RUBGE|nr:hypothetical protein [Rubrivivax gelatinosus]MBK1686995.1 hypothetical protein [Rubrivivax gelatinosus]TCP02178.1 hypothetical protein EV684_107184 [Rubrivivax gelatinosus]
MPARSAVAAPNATSHDRGRRRLIAAAAGAALAPWGGAANAMEAPAGPVVLTLIGRVLSPNFGARADFDMTMLERLPQTSFTTRTPWYSTARRFTGPLLRDVLAMASARGSQLRAIALNDYWVDIPFDDTARHDVIVARLLDGRPMAVRDKGPLFVIYPFDSNEELRTPVYYSRSAWQLRTIEVR